MNPRAALRQADESTFEVGGDIVLIERSDSGQPAESRRELRRRDPSQRQASARGLEPTPDAALNNPPLGSRRTWKAADPKGVASAEPANAVGGGMAPTEG